MSQILAISALAAMCTLAFVKTANTQVIMVYRPNDVYHVSAPRMTPSPVTTTYAPTITSTHVPVVTYYAPSSPVTTYYLPSRSVTTYYAPPVSTTVLSPVVPVATYYRGPVWVYDPTRILPRRRWRLVFP